MNDWLKTIKSVRASNPKMSFKQAMKEAKKVYKKK